MHKKLIRQPTDRNNEKPKVALKFSRFEREMINIRPKDSTEVVLWSNYANSHGRRRSGMFITTENQERWQINIIVLSNKHTRKKDNVCKYLKTKF